ncbi:MAG: hypothetical protein WCO44_12660 [Bacteroidota bacterium]
MATQLTVNAPPATLALAGTMTPLLILAIAFTMTPPLTLPFREREKGKSENRHERIV